MSAPRGKLVVVEGLDKAGKSSQCERLEAKMVAKGLKASRISFPDRSTPTGRLIDAYLKGEVEQNDQAIHLLFSANRWEAAAKIRAEIEAGTNVIVDRYYYSGCVYSAAKGVKSLDLVWARKPDEGLPRPDVVIFLGITPEEAAKRGGFGDEKYETKAMQDRVRQLFLQLQRVQPEKQDFVRIDGGKAAEDVAEDVWEAVFQAFKRVDLYNDALRVVEPWTEDAARAIKAASSSMVPAAASNENGAKAQAASNSSAEKRSLQPQWTMAFDEGQPKQRGIKIQGDGMGNRKTTEKQWWEYE